ADAEPGDAAADRGAELTRLEGPRVEARRVTGIGTRGGFEEQGEVRAARAERADVQHRRGGGEPDPLERNAPVGRLEPEHARVRGGDADRATRVGPDGKRSEPERDRHGRARRAPARE